MKFLAKLIAVIVIHAILLAIFGPIGFSVMIGVLAANAISKMTEETVEIKTGVTGYEVSAPTPAYTAPKKDKLIEVRPNQFKII